MAVHLKVCGRTRDSHWRYLVALLSGTLILPVETKPPQAADQGGTQEARPAKTVAQVIVPSPYGEGDNDEEEGSLFCQPLSTCRADMVSPSPAISTPPNMEGLDKSRIKDLFSLLDEDEDETSTQTKTGRAATEDCSVASTQPKSSKMSPASKSSWFQEEQPSFRRATPAPMDAPSTPAAQTNKGHDDYVPPTRAVSKERSWTPARESFERRRMAKMRGSCSPVRSPRPNQTRR